MKKKRHRLTSAVFRGVGIGCVFTGTVGGFVGYQMVTDWEAFQKEAAMIVVSSETAKLNPFLAFPTLIGMIVFALVMMRKNKTNLQDKASITLLFAIAFSYMVYSVIEIAMFAMIGAFAGTALDEFIFHPLAISQKKKHEENIDVDSEYKREKKRIIARKEAERELDGSA